MPNFFNKYPYTDFHELNLDWILSIIKEIIGRLDKNDLTVANSIEVKNLILDGTTDNTDTIIEGLRGQKGVFIVPGDCKCDVERILQNLNNDVLVIDATAEHWVGGYRKRMFTFATNTTLNDDFGVAIEDNHHPALFLINHGDYAGESVHRSSLIFADGYGPGIDSPNTSYQLLHEKSDTTDSFRLMHKGSTVYATNDLKQSFFNAFSDSSPFDYIFNPTLRDSDKSILSINSPSESTLDVRTANSVTFQIVTSTSDVKIIKDGSSIATINASGLHITNVPLSIDTTLIEKITDVSGPTPTITTPLAYVNNTAATNMTNLTYTGNKLTLVFVNGNTTLVNGNFRLQGGTNWTPTSMSSITFVRNTSYSTAWIEISRTQM